MSPSWQPSFSSHFHQLNVEQSPSSLIILSIHEHVSVRVHTPTHTSIMNTIIVQPIPYTVYHEKIACLKRLRLRVLRRVRKLFLLAQNFYTYTCRCKRDVHTQSLEHNLNKIWLLASFYWSNFFRDIRYHTTIAQVKACEKPDFI